jgi:Glu-tRNA(Gln) amidotransferase subunit E-like FAD-binding protein
VQEPVKIKVENASKVKVIDDSTIRGIVFGNNRAMLNYSSFSDFKFIVKGKVFNVHKSFLAASSSVFRQMFVTEMEESRTNECKIDDIEPEIFEQMLKFIYCGDIDKASIDSLFQVAHRYDIKGLKEVCSKGFNAELSKENALEVYKFASIYDDDLKELKEGAWKIVKR